MFMDLIAVGGFDRIVDSQTSQASRADKTVRVVDLVAESKHLAGLLCDGDSVGSKYLDRDTERLGRIDGSGSVGTGRVKHGKKTKKLPLTVSVHSKSEQTETSEANSPAIF